MNSDSSNAVDQRARREAAEWLTKHDRGLTATEQDAFLQWLVADARHRAWFSRHRAGWQRLDALVDWRPEQGYEPNPDVLAPPARRTRWLRPAMLTAMAAGLALGTGLFLRRVPYAAPTMAVAPGETGGYERRLLDDGSVAELNGDAEIEISFTAAERRVVLRRGEALFTVTKNPRRPFIVSARGVDVRAVGTAFNVRLDLGSVEVLVTEGRVQMAPPAGTARETVAVPPPFVRAGESAVVSLAADAAPRISPTTAAALARLRAWQPQLLDFSSTPLEEVLAEFNRRNRVQLVLVAPASARVPIIASIRSDNIEGFVSLVARAAGLEAERRGAYEIVLRPAR